MSQDTTRVGRPGETHDHSHRFAIVDVFSDSPLAGNPLAVVADADDLDDRQMADIAVEFNLSETTFLSRATLPGADVRLRSFTPGGEEVAGAGHNALGAWWWLAATGAASAPGATQELGGRALPVLTEESGGSITIGLDQGRVEWASPLLDSQDVVAALALGAHDPLDPDLALVIGSVGSPHLLVPLATRDDVDRADPDRAALLRLLAATGAEGCYVYTREPGADGHDAYARFFNPTVGISEDPATGTAAGPLAAHLHRTGHVGHRVRILQGRALGRPSTLAIDVGPRGTRLTGRCALAATGQLCV